MARKSPFEQMPIAYLSTYDNVRQVDSIVSQMEAGFFYDAAVLFDQVLRDDRIRGDMTTRVSSLLGKPLTFEPAKDNGTHRNIAEEIESDWPQMFSDSVLTELLMWGIGIGVGLGQVVQDGSRWRLEVWHPWALQWDVFRRVWLVQTTDGRIELARDEYGYVDERGTRWVLFTPYGVDSAGRRGMLRSLGRLYLERQWVRRDRARYSEVHGEPVRVGIAPIGAAQEAVDAYHGNLSTLGSDSAVVIRQGEPGNMWDLKLVEATGKSHEGFEMALTELGRAISVLLLGQWQSTEGQAGLGSNAQAGDSVRGDLLQAEERALSHALRNQFLMPYCAFAYQKAQQAPYPCWAVEPPEDELAKAQELNALGDALNKLKAAGAPIDVRAILEEHGIPMISEAEQAALDAAKAKADAQAAADAAAAQAGSNPMNGMAPMNGAAKDTAPAPQGDA